MPTITPIYCRKAQGMGNTIEAKCSVAMGQGETLWSMSVVIYAAGYTPMVNMMSQDSNGDFVTASAMPPMGSSAPYTYRFRCEYRVIADSAAGDVTGF